MSTGLAQRDLGPQFTTAAARAESKISGTMPPHTPGTEELSGFRQTLTPATLIFTLETRE